MTDETKQPDQPTESTTPEPQPEEQPRQPITLKQVIDFLLSYGNDITEVKNKEIKEVEDALATRPEAPGSSRNYTIRQGLKNPFIYIAPSKDNVQDITVIRTFCLGLDHLMQELTPSSRELSLARTKLEECSMWFNKAVVMNNRKS